MTAREWLELVRSHAASLERLHREYVALLEAHEQCLPWTPRDAMPHGSGTHSDPTASAAQARIEGLDAEIESKAAEIAESERVVGACLRMLSEMRQLMRTRHADVLEIYYIDCAATWSEVADEMGITYRRVQQLRSEAYLLVECRWRDLL